MRLTLTQIQLPLQLLFIRMFENNSSISINDNKSERILPASDFSSLPYIYQKIPSKKETQTPPNIHPKQKLKLPRIKQDQEYPRYQRTATQPDQTDQSPKLRLKHDQVKPKNTFARQVEERMRFVLGGLETNNKGDFMDGYDSEDFDFEAKVNANRQLIKMNRQKNDKKNPSSMLDKRPPVAPQTANKAIKRKQSMSHKKVVNMSRERDPSIQNKYGSNKRKQSLKRPTGTPTKHVPPFSSKRQSLKDLRSKPYHIPKTETNQKHHIKQRVNSHNSVQKQKPAGLKLEIQRNGSLFDGIQNYLSNPVTSKKHSIDKQRVGLSLLKAKRDLEDKIKQINQKLGIQEDKQSISPSTTHQSQDSDGNKLELTDKQWKRILVLNKEMSYEQTNFDKEIERLTEMQQKNGACLENYLQHQKRLVELELSKKMRMQAKVQASNSH